MECCQKRVRLVFSPFFFSGSLWEKSWLLVGSQNLREQQNEENIYFAYLRFDYGNSMLNEVSYHIDLWLGLCRKRAV